MRSGPSVYRREALALTMAIALIACDRADAPEDPAWGKQPCAHCAMLVADKRFAAQLLTARGERLHFDDLGCMVLWLEGHAPARRLWVRDATTGAWLDAPTARYIAGARTPMDFDFEAQERGGVEWEAMRAAVGARARARRGSR